MIWLRRLFHKSRAETQLDKELRFHIEQQVADNVGAGMSPHGPSRFQGYEVRTAGEVRD